MDFEFLTNKIKYALNYIDIEYLTEIRLRIGYPIIVKYNNERLYMGENCLTKSNLKAITCDKHDIDNIILNVTEKSIYAFNEKIKQGYLTTRSGIRIGLSGECVKDNEKIITLKNFTSLNIRIPHNIKNSSKDIFKKVYSENNLFNTLIISPPTYGKTTILKDLAIKLNELNKYSILIIDERGEFISVNGENIDTIKYSDKLYAFEYAIRSMSPDVIITDELANRDDWECVKKASNSGVKVIASCHAKTIENVIAKDYFSKGIFELYAVLDSNGKIGILNNLYDKDFNVL